MGSIVHQVGVLEGEVLREECLALLPPHYR